MKTLRLGDKGEAVRCLNRALGSDPYPNFDEELDAKVKSFQLANGLTPDGICGGKTWAALRGFDVIEDHKCLTHWGVRSKRIEGVVVHHSDTKNPDTTTRVLESRGLSTHYEVSSSGQIYEYGDPTEQVAWHCGGGVNHRSIGIDATHRSKKAWPDDQVVAVNQLLTWLCKLYGLPLVTAPDKSLGKGGLSAEWGIYRHRNLAATACPEDLPLP